MNTKTMLTRAGLALTAPLGRGASKPPLASSPAAVPALTASSSNSDSAQSTAAEVQAPAANSNAPGVDGFGCVYFDCNRRMITTESKPVTKANAQFLDSHRAAHVQLQGNCGSRESQEYNLALGQSRANAVMQAMAVLGVNANATKAISDGLEKTCHARADFAHDRQADIVCQRKAHGARNLSSGCLARPKNGHQERDAKRLGRSAQPELILLMP